jgi:hypothetical protein
MADVNKAVLVTFGAIGQEKLGKALSSTAAKVGIVIAAVAMLTKKFLEAMDSAQDFRGMVERTTLPIGKLNAETKGLIDTTTMYSQALKLQQADRKLTADELAAIGKAAVVTGQALGENGDQLTARFVALTDAVISGRERALLPYGIELKETSDKAEKAADAVRQLKEKFGEATVAVEGFDDQLYALKNTIGTVFAFEFAAATKDLDAFLGKMIGENGASDVLRQWEYDLTSTSGKMAEFSSVLGDSITIALAHDEQLWDNIRTAESYDKILKDFIHTGQLDEALTLMRAKAYRRLAGQMRINIALAESMGSNLANQLGGKMLMAQKSGMSGAVAAAGASVSRPRGGGRSAAVSPIDDLFNAPMRETGIDIFGDSGIDPLEMGSIFAPEGTGASAASEQYAASLAGRQAMLEQQADMAIEAQRIEQENARSHVAILLGIEKDSMAERQRMYETDAEYRVNANFQAFQSMTSAVMTYATLQEAKSAEGLAMQKAVLIPATIANGIAASIGAIRSVMVSGIPFPASLITAIAVSGSVMAASVKAAVDIGKQKLGGVSAPSSSMASSSSFNAGGLGAAQGGSGQTIVNNIVVDGQIIHSSLLNVNRRASQAGSPAFEMR